VKQGSTSLGLKSNDYVVR